MRLSMLASSALAIGFISLSSAAYAGCGNNLVCNSNQGYSSYSSGYSGGYSSSYNASSYGGTASCPAGTRASSDGTCLMNETTSLYSGGSSHSSSSYAPSTSYSSHSSSYAPSTSYSSYSSSYTPSVSYSSGYSSSSSSSSCPSGSSRGADGLCMSHSSGSSYSTDSHTIVPFSTSVSSISNYRLDGMGANEHLSPTTCPVSVHNPSGGKVLGCYSVVKPAPVVVRPAPVIVRVPTYRQVRVVRPIVYVRYPVPVAVPYLRPTCNAVTSWSRYGGNWPRAGWGRGGSCGGW